jgi:Family of unknown function (DUF5996)
MNTSPATCVTDLPECWPPLPLDSWEATRATLHMWTQMVGKVRLALSPPLNHWWNVPLYVTPRGLTTSAIPYGARVFEIHFDFIDHVLVLRTDDGAARSLPLSPRSVADFYREFTALLHDAGIRVHIWKMPVEIPGPIPFDGDRVHAAYDPAFAQRFWKILLTVDRVFAEFRSRFLGKSSPVHFFWGSFDLAVTRFSGRPAPDRPGADAMSREAYSHEVSSVGFWPGGGDVREPMFYSYMAPEPQGFRESPVRPAAAFYHARLGEFLLPYEAARKSASPTGALLDFCQSAYEAGATLGHWDRAALERSFSPPASAAG